MPTVETTFTKYPHGTRAGNYCTLPTLDVPILPSVHHCTGCDAEVAYVAPEGRSWWGEWRHVDGTTGHHVDPRPSCRYCHTEEGVEVVNHPWHTATECSRCGGRDGWALGD